MNRKKQDCPLPIFIFGIVLLLVIVTHSGYGFAAIQDRDGAPARQAVAITVDDVPYVGGPQHIEDARRVTERFLQVVREHAVPVSAFVTGANVLVEGQVDDRMALLERWCDAGIDLEGHSNSHLSINDLGLQNYIDDVVQGLLFPKRVMEARGRAVQFYRHPFNHTGANEQAKRAFEDFLRARKIQLAPFTVEHADYLFNSIYLDARARADLSKMKQVTDAYLTQLDVAFNFAERISRENFGREIRQIFLIHANVINAEFLDAMLDRLKERGYQLVGLNEALQDPAYETPDKYVGRTGISWLHRWREVLGLPSALREEPDPPKWILDDYEKLRR